MTLRRLALFSAFALTPFAYADEIRLKDGSVLRGKLQGLENGLFSIKSDSVKEPIKVRQADIATFSTDGEYFFDTLGRSRAKGKIESTPEGVKVTTADGVVVSRVDNLVEAWAPGEPSPEDKAQAKLARNWGYSADISVLGQTGNGESIGIGAGLAAVNKGPDDELKFYAKVNYAKAKAGSGGNWNKTADDLNAGLEYTSYFARPQFWYVRSNNGYNKVQEISFFTTTAAGLGHLFIDKETQHLSAQAGLAYRYETYRNNLRDDVSAAGLDLGLHHDCQFDVFSMVNNLSVTPAFDDFSNIIAVHDSFVEMPLLNTKDWKLRMGVNNQYRSKVPTGVDRLITTYSLRFVLNWK